MQAPINNDHPAFTNPQLLDYYEQSLFQAFHQVEELKRFTRSRRRMGLCVNCSSSKSSLSTHRKTEGFKKIHGRQSSKLTSIEKVGPPTSDGLLLAVDKFLTGEFKG